MTSKTDFQEIATLFQKRERCILKIKHTSRG
jgi:hypothetical protein